MATIDQAKQQIEAYGPPLPDGHPIADGKFHRFGPKKAAWYRLNEIVSKSSGQVMYGGTYGIWQGDNENTEHITMDWAGVTPEDRAAAEVARRALEVLEAGKKAQLAINAANRARSQWAAAATTGNSPYLERKHITAPGLRYQVDGTLLVPMLSASAVPRHLVGLQKIAPDATGTKRYSGGMAKKGACCPIGDIKEDDPALFVTEGYATGRSVRMASNDTMGGYVAFDAGNLMEIVLMARTRHPTQHILMCSDDDDQLVPRLSAWLLAEFKLDGGVEIDGIERTLTATDGAQVRLSVTWRHDARGVRYIDADARSGRRLRQRTFENTGVARATAAARAVGNASIVCPRFANRGDNKWSDFNDLHVQESLDVVATQIAVALSAAQQPILASAVPAFVAIPSLDVDATESPLPPGAQQPARRSFDGAEADATTDPLLAAMLEARFNECDPDDGLSDVGALSHRGAGEEGKAQKDKPKKIYGDEHWNQVSYVLKNFTLIYGEDLVWDCGQTMLMKISSMRTIVSNSDVMRFWGGDARKWALKKNIVFDPQETPSPAQSGPTATINLFSGWKMRPKPGKSDQIQLLLYHLCNGDDDLMLWIERWLAYPLRHRGAKMETSIIMHGDEGSGKNFFFEKVIKRIYGEYGYVIGNAQLESQFNDWAGMKLFMVADEVVTRSELKQMKGKLKYLVSGDMIIINPKGLPEHGEENHINFVFLSNELQPLALDKTDRRYLVIWTPPALPKEFYVGVAEEIAAGGIEAYFHYLLHDVDMGDFNEHTKPLYTDAKDELIEKSLTPAERFYRDWSRGFLPLSFITCGATQLYDAYKVWCEKSGESKYISQTIFSPTVLRYAGDAMEKRLIKYEYGNVVKQRNVFLIGAPKKDQTLADWVTGASELFEKDLAAYRSRSAAHVEG